MSTIERDRKVLVFTGQDHSASTIEHIEAVADAFPHWHFTILEEKPPRRRSLRESISYPLQVIEGLMVRFKRRKTGKVIGGPLLPESLAQLSRPNVAYRQCQSLCDPETVQYVRGLRPWLGICLAAPILQPVLFTIPQAGTINLRKSLLPNYRGMPPGFWELHDGATETGAIVHYVEEGLETGQIVAEASLPIAPFSTPVGLAVELDLLGTKVLLAALTQLEKEEVTGIPQPPAAIPTNRQPSWLEARRVSNRCWQRRETRSWPRRFQQLMKLPVLLFFLYLFVPLRNAFRRLRGCSHTSILLFHRVSDWYVDSVTVGIEQFQEQLQMLKRDYEVMDLPSFLASWGRPRTHPAVVLAFDDGYEDNLAAALLLRRAGLPCTFFISTRIIDSELAFPHDIEKLGRRVPSLSWDQVRQIAQWGFAISNHTTNHANLGKVSVHEAMEEITTAIADLKKELGKAAFTQCLAFPYGLPQDMPEDVRARLEEVGIHYCFSAYGGTNPPRFDRLNILRTGSDVNFSLLRLRAAVEGWPATSTRWEKENSKRAACKCDHRAGA